MRKVELIAFFLCVFQEVNGQSLIDTSLLKQELKEFNIELDNAAMHKDSILLEKLISKEFLRIHGTNGAVELRNSWINGILKGSPNSKDIQEDNFNKSTVYPAAAAAIEIAIVRRRTYRDQREIWLLRSNFYAKEIGGWKLVRMQGTLMHDGPIYLVKPEELNEYTGNYQKMSNPNQIFKIKTLENQALYCPVPEGYWLIFFKTNYDRFVSQGGIYTIVFERDNNKRLTGFAYYHNSKSLVQDSLVEQASKK